MFDSKLTDYKISNTPFKRDICAELARACHEGGVALGFYYSPPDWHHPDFFTANQARYDAYFHGQVRELLSHYGRVDELWFDWNGGINTPQTWDNESLFPMIRKLQPQILITKRCGGWGDFNTPEQRVGTYDDKSPWETCMTIGTQWSWKPDDTLKSAADVIRILATCAGGDGNLLLDVGPMPDGRIEPRQVDILKQVGEWLNKNGESIYGTRGGPWKPNKDVASTRRGNVIYVHVLNTETDTIVLPVIARQIVSADLVDGGSVGFTSRDGRLILKVPAGQRDGDTVVKLTLDGTAMDLAAVDVVTNNVQ
jgi:alpha-L-fucosidase